MNKYANCVASIDVGTQNIKILVARELSSGKLQIIAKSCVATRPNSLVRGEIRNIDVSESINAALQEIKKNYGIEIKKAFVGLSGEHIVCEKQHGYVFVKGADGAVRENDVEELFSSMKNYKLEPGKQIISILPQCYYVDEKEEVQNPVGMISTKLEGDFNTIIGDERNTELYARVLAKCNIGISDMILSSIASSRALLVEGEDEMGVMVVDIGAGTTDVAIFMDRNLKYMGVIPIGGNAINRDIRSLGIMERYTENLKVFHGSAVASLTDKNVTISLPGVGRMAGKEFAKANLANIIEARLIDIITYLIDTLNIVDMKDKLNAGIIITGGGANMENIELLFAKYFDCPIRVATPVEHVDESYFDLIQDAKYSTAVGLLLEGFASNRKSVVVPYDNFLDEKFEPVINVEVNENNDNEQDLFSSSVVNEVEKSNPVEVVAVVEEPEKEVKQESIVTDEGNSIEVTIESEDDAKSQEGENDSIVEPEKKSKGFMSRYGKKIGARFYEFFGDND